eukprot:scaffold287415_cov31-Tisochrysis_lutea.AAC.2
MVRWTVGKTVLDTPDDGPFSGLPPIPVASMDLTEIVASQCPFPNTQAQPGLAQASQSHAASPVASWRETLRKTCKQKQGATLERPTPICGVLKVLFRKGPKHCMAIRRVAVMCRIRVDAPINLLASHTHSSSSPD